MLAIRRILISVLFVSAVLAVACSGGGSANESAGQAPVQPFAEVTDARQALAIGNELLENNETERAIDAYLRATDLDPGLAEAWFKLGIAYALIEKEQQIAAQADANSISNSEDPQKKTRTNSEKAFRKAIEAYKKLIQQNPDDDAAYFNLGRAYNKLNEDEEAAKALKQAVRIKPDDTDYQTELGAILIKLAQYREAIPPLKKALELDPENSRAAGLLEDAEAGRSRIDYVPPKKNENANSNANSNSNSELPANGATPPPTNTGQKPPPRPTPTRKPTNSDDR